MIDLEKMKTLAHEKECEKDGDNKCEYCGGTGIIEISGDDGSGNWDKVGEKVCVCQE